MLKTTLTIIVVFGLLFWCGSCRKDFEYTPSNGTLSFSKDTVFLDTVFNNIGSSTYSLKVYNTGRNDILVPSIRLEKGNSSFYRLNVDGKAGQDFQDIPIAAQDSMFIFIETTVDLGINPENTLLYTDALVFDSGTFEQQVQLVTLAKDAVFLYPARNPDGTKESVFLSIDDAGNEIRIEGFILQDDQLRFTNEKPYVIYGYAAVAESKSLTIDAGARIHFHKDSGLLVQDGGSIAINGVRSVDKELLEGEVIFEGDRLEPAFSDVSGQWGLFWLAAGARNSTIDYLTVKNGSVGLLVEGDGTLLSPTLQIRNSQIFNNSSHNVWARNAFINGENLVLGSSGAASLYLNLGGNYTFTHCTIANFWSNGFRNSSALEIDNVLQLSETNSITSDLIQADFRNCIIDGNTQLELLLEKRDEALFNYTFSNCLIKFNDIRNQFEGDELYDFQNTERYSNIKLGFESDFFFPSRNDFRIGLASDAQIGASMEFSQDVPLDLLGNDRLPSPHIGSYQAAENPQ